MFQLFLNIRDDIDLPHCLYRKLRLGVERAQAFDFVAKQLDAKRVLAGVGIDVHDAAAQRKLPGLKHEIGHLEAVVVQEFGNESRVELLPYFYRKSIGQQRPLVDYLLKKRLGIGHDLQRWYLGDAELVQNLGPHQNAGVVDFLVLVRPLVGSRIEQNILSAEQTVQIVLKISRLVAVAQHVKRHAGRLAVQRGGHHGIQTTNQALDLHTVIYRGIDLAGK